MTRLQKKIITEMFGTLKNAISDMQKAEKSADPEKVIALLSVYQESAVSIGSAVERIAGEGTATVAILERFCEEVYIASVKITEGKEDTQISGELLNSVLEAEEVFEKEFIVKSTVVFMPIDASWWDGLESVWKKEKSCPETTVYVVPIPWYELEQGSDRQVEHYELSAYPEEAEVIDYSEFELSAVRPDVIYIQYAMDGAGLWKTIRNEHFTHNLKQYTNELVYIPYRLESEVDLDKKERLDKLSDHIFVPGLDNVDKVIVQSEAMKKAYVRILEKRDKDCEIEDDRDWNSIIQGSGSPRLDRILKMKPEDVTIPDDWKSYIFKNDGSRKKIILYSNSAYTFLEGEKNMIDKVRDSFEVFKNNRDDIALIWRPHPDTKEIIKTLRPNIIDDYERLVDYYISEKIGIYDDDKDFARAVVLSDALYGDDSTFIGVYRATGKPIMIENPEIRASYKAL